MALTMGFKGKIKFPDIDFSKELEEVAEKVIIPAITSGIHNQKDYEGNTYPSLAASTIKRKGHTRPLIDTGKLHRSSKFKGAGKNRVIIYVGSERKDVAKALQVDGIKTKKGKRYFKFFGISTQTEKKAVKKMAEKIGEYIKRARR